MATAEAAGLIENGDRGLSGQSSSYQPNAITFLPNGSLNTAGVASSLSVAVDSALSRVDFSRAVVCCSASAAAYVSAGGGGGGGGGTAYRPVGGGGASNWTWNATLPSETRDVDVNVNVTRLNVSNVSSSPPRLRLRDLQQVQGAQQSQQGAAGGVCPNGVARFCLTAPNAAVTVNLTGISVAEGDGGESFCVSESKSDRWDQPSSSRHSQYEYPAPSHPPPTVAGQRGAVRWHLCANG